MHPNPGVPLGDTTRLSLLLVTTGAIVVLAPLTGFLGLSDRRHLPVLLGLSLGALFVLFLVALVRYLRLQRQLRTTRDLLEQRSTLDDLTGLWNRRVILARLEAEHERCRRAGGALCCLLLDVDHIKQVNDRFGQAAGDKVLGEVANILRSSLRTYDIAGRYGGEEFLIILPGADLETGRLTAERIRKSVADLVWAGPPEGSRQGVTVSLGVAEAFVDETVAQLLIRTDLALFRAKQGGRNRVGTEG